MFKVSKFVRPFFTHDSSMFKLQHIKNLANNSGHIKFQGKDESDEYCLAQCALIGKHFEWNNIKSIIYEKNNKNKDLVIFGVIKNGNTVIPQYHTYDGDVAYFFHKFDDITFTRLKLNNMIAPFVNFQD